MEFEKLIAISGQGSLFKILNRTKFGLVAENLETGKKAPVYTNQQVSTLQDISMFTVDGDVPLREVFIKVLEFSKANSLPDYKNASGAEIREFFLKVLPDHDQERVRDADIRKVIRWFNQMVKNGLNEVSQLEIKPSDNEEKSADTTEATKAPKTNAGTKAAARPAKPTTKAAPAAQKKTSMVRKAQ